MKSDKKCGRICVLGSGSWGTALSVVASVPANEVVIWGRDAGIASGINQQHQNLRYLPSITLASNIRATTDLDEALQNSDLIINAIPTQSLNQVFSPLSKKIPSSTTIVNSSKGICTQTLRLPVEIIAQALGRKNAENICVVSGPSFAKETAEKQPTAVTLAGPDLSLAEKVGGVLFTPWFRTYPSSDWRGVELAGASKNVIAIASGIASGLGLGFNTQSALITRGLAEMSRLGQAYGADPLTFLGLAGVGDLVLTCTGHLSRNRTLGNLLAKGQSLEEARKALGQVAEGEFTTKALFTIAQKKKIEMPIVQEIHRILFEGKSPRSALTDLMGRPMRTEQN